MNRISLKIIIVAAALSLTGVLITQSLWLKKTFEIEEKQFDHRADQMLNDVVDELKVYADTSSKSQYAKKLKNPCIFDVLDTLLLKELINKYSKYHLLDSVYSYGLVISGNNKIIYTVNGFVPSYESLAYKVCLSCIWQEEYIHISVYYPNKEKNIFGKQIIWIVLSVFFLVVIMGALVFVIVGHVKQKKITEIRNDFVNNMTHELKTPLSTISVAAEVLMKAPFDEDNSKRLKKYSKVISEENQRMKKLVDKVLSLATLDRGMLTLEKEEININQAICMMIENFCFEAFNNNVSLDFKLHAKNSIIEADKIHFRNILINLVDNAIKYSEGQPHIVVETENIKGFCKISITDNGKGIPRDSLKKVFDKFYRVPCGNIHNVKGFGLGLYYVKTMVEAHNGQIEINSAVNQGTSVSVFFPQ